MRLRPATRSFLALLSGFLVLAIIGFAMIRSGVLLGPDAAPRAEPVQASWASLAVSATDKNSIDGFDAYAGLLSTPDRAIHVSKRFKRPLKGDDMRLARPFLSRPRNASVLYGFFDGAESELHLLDMSTAVDSLLATGPEIYHSAALVGQTAYVLMLDPITRTERGIFRVAQGSSPTLVIEPRQLPTEALVGSSLYVTPSGGHILVNDCTFSACTLRLYATSLDRSATMSAIGNASVLGVTDGLIAVSPFCNLQCPREFLALPTLERTKVGLSCGPNSLAFVLGRPAVVSGSRGDCSAPGDELIAQWPDAGRKSVGLASLSTLILVEASWSQVFEVRAGQVLLTADGTLGSDQEAVLYDINSGTTSETTIVHPD